MPSKHHRNRQEPMNSNAGSASGFTTVTHHNKSASLPSRTSSAASEELNTKPKVTEIFAKQGGDSASISPLQHSNKTDDDKSVSIRSEDGNLSQDELSERGHLDRSSMTKSQRRRINRHSSQKSKSVESSDGHPSPTNQEDTVQEKSVLDPVENTVTADPVKLSKSVPSKEPASHVVKEPKSEPSSGSADKPASQIVKEPKSEPSSGSAEKPASQIVKEPKSEPSSGSAGKRKKAKAPRARGVDSPVVAKDSANEVVQFENVNEQITANGDGIHSSLTQPKLGAESFVPVRVETVKVYQLDPEATILRENLAKAHAEVKGKISMISELEKLVASIPDLKKKAEMLEENNRSLEITRVDLETQKKRNGDLEAQVNFLSEERDKLVQQHVEKQSLLKNLLNEVDSVKEKLAAQEEVQDRSALVLQENEELKQKMAELEEGLQKYSLKDSESANNVLAQENEALLSRIADMENRLRASEENSQHMERLRHEFGEHEKLVMNNGEIQKELEIIRVKLGESEARLKNSENKSKEVDELKNQLDMTQRELEEETKIRAELKNQLDKTQRKLEEDTKIWNEIIERENSRVNTEVAERERKLQEAVESVSASNAVLSQQLETVNKELEKATALRDNLERETPIYDSEVNKLRSELDQLESENRSLCTQLESVNAQLQQAKEREEKVEVRIKELESLAFKVAELNEQARSREDREQELEERNRTVSHSLAIANQSIKEQNEKIKILEMTLEAEKSLRLEAENFGGTKEYLSLVSGGQNVDTRDIAVGSPRPAPLDTESQTETNHFVPQEKEPTTYTAVAHHIIGVRASPQVIREERYLTAVANEKEQPDAFGMPDFVKRASNGDARVVEDVEVNLNTTAVEPALEVPLMDPRFEPAISNAVNGNTSSALPDSGPHPYDPTVSEDDKATRRKFNDLGPSSFSVADAVRSVEEDGKKIELTKDQSTLSNPCLSKDVLQSKDVIFSSSLVPSGSDGGSSLKMIISCSASFGLGLAAAYVIARNK